MIIGFIWIFNSFLLSVAMFQIRMNGKECVPEYYITGDVGVRIFQAYAFFAFAFYYATPTALFIILYGK